MPMIIDIQRPYAYLRPLSRCHAERCHVMMASHAADIERCIRRMRCREMSSSRCHAPLLSRPLILRHDAADAHVAISVAFACYRAYTLRHAMLIFAEAPLSAAAGFRADSLPCRYAIEIEPKRC